MAAKRRQKQGETAIEYQQRKVEEARIKGDPKAIHHAEQVLALVRACR